MENQLISELLPQILSTTWFIFGQHYHVMIRVDQRHQSIQHQTQEHAKHSAHIPPRNVRKVFCDLCHSCWFRRDMIGLTGLWFVLPWITVSRYSPPLTTSPPQASAVLGMLYLSHMRHNNHLIWPLSNWLRATVPLTSNISPHLEM